MSDFVEELTIHTRRCYDLICDQGACSVESAQLKPSDRLTYQHNFHARKGPDSQDDPDTVRIQNLRAVSVCIRCPVRQPCLEYALATHQPTSIWGGYKDNVRALVTAEVTGVPVDYAPSEWTEQSWTEVLSRFEEMDSQEIISHRSKKIENLYAKLASRSSTNAT